MKRLFSLMVTTVIFTCLCLGCGYQSYQQSGTNKVRQGAVGNIPAKLLEIIKKGETVSLGVYVSDVKNTCPLERNVLHSWEASTREGLGDFNENHFLRLFKQYPNFLIVDRERLGNILRELQLSQTGLINNETRMEVGKLVGITYLVDITLSRYCEFDIVEDQQWMKLLNIKTSQILATDRMRFEKRFSKWSGKYELIRSELNQQEVILGADGYFYYK